MNEKKWIGFLDAAEVDASPKMEVSKSSGTDSAGERTVLTVRYSVRGAWEGAVGDFQKVEVPKTSAIEAEGAPALPKDGLFVAVPTDAEDVTVRLLDKSYVTLDHQVRIAPAPKQFMEGDFREVYEPDSAIYSSDTAYPGRDFDFLGIKTVSGVKVAHLVAYLGQYHPLSMRMDVAQSLVFEVSYRTKPSTDRPSRRQPREVPEGGMILGLELLEAEGVADGPLRAGELLHVDTETTDEFFRLRSFRGMSLLTDTDEELAVGAAISSHVLGSLAALLRPQLKRTGIIAEYVIITPRSLETAVAPLLAAKSGWPFYAKVALTEDVQSEFPAADLKESIKFFITWAAENWHLPPRFVVLAGDTDIIPMHIYERGGNQFASDHYYADIAAEDLSPEISVSRIPTSDPAQMKSVCEYLVRYQERRGTDWGWWQNRIMLCAYESATYETTCDELANKMQGRFSVIKNYARDTGKADVVKTMNDGVLLAIYRGHGSQTAWSSGNGLSSDDVAHLSNAPHPPFVLSICCQNGWVDENKIETIAEAFIRREKAVSVLASSRNSWTYPNNDFARYLADAMMTGGCHTPAAIIKYAKTKMIKNHPDSSYHADNTVMYNLFGDPTANVASNAEWLRGDWAMDHDGWRGTLSVTRIWDCRVEQAAAPVWSIAGEYTGSDGKKYPFEGTLGAADDANQLGAGSKRSDHKIDFRINFSPSNNQRFAGYVHTWTLTRMAGLTWWSEHPFSWTAQKVL